MEEKIKQLYMEINYIGYRRLESRKNDYIEQAKKRLPMIEEFTTWFLSGNQFGIEDELYQALQANLLTILDDIVTAAKENDTVLMLDALEGGISEYLTMFVPEEYFAGKKVLVQ